MHEGATLEFVERSGRARYRLAGRPLNGGDSIDLCFSGGWVTGRFEWSGDAKERPRFHYSLELQQEGRVCHGALEIPERAILRWPGATNAKVGPVLRRDDLTLSIADSASGTVRDFLDDQLYEFNVVATGIADGRGLAVYLRAPSGELIGAAVGYTWGGTCELRQVWVHASHRGQGFGTLLLETARTEAVARGCSQLLLTTHSFQAPRFYQKLGFAQVAKVDDYPSGHAQLVLRLDLAAPADDSA